LAILGSLREGGKWDSHVVLFNILSEVSEEVVVGKGGIVLTWGWQSADSINSVVALNITASDKLKQGHEVAVQVSWQTKTLEVDRELDWVVGAQLVPVVR